MYNNIVSILGKNLFSKKVILGHFCVHVWQRTNLNLMSKSEIIMTGLIWDSINNGYKNKIFCELNFCMSLT